MSGWPTVGFYRCYSMSFITRRDESSISALQHGGKIILPQSALETIAQHRVSYPMLFQVRSRARPANRTHCGVLEFSAEEGRCYIPRWMQEQLLVGDSDVIEVVSVSLPVARSIRLQPHSSDFLDITDHRAVLENVMTCYAAVTEGDAFCILYNRRSYYISVRQVAPQSPAHAASIIETDVSIEFDPPQDYKEPAAAPAGAAAASESDGALVFGDEPHVSPPPAAATSPAAAGAAKTFAAFAGAGQRLDGRAPRAAAAAAAPAAPAAAAAPSAAAAHAATEQKSYHSFVAFSGKGHRLNE
eukprot:m51a1_g9950 putative ubiquitin fusion degradation 1 isoform 1 (300) ;mRNA; f:23583-24887